MHRQSRIAFVLFASTLLIPAPAAAQGKPAVLFCSPQGPAYGWVDLNYLDQLHERGIEVDYTESLADVTADRIRSEQAWSLVALVPGHAAGAD